MQREIVKRTGKNKIYDEWRNNKVLVFISKIYEQYVSVFAPEGQLII
jgi:hypothetical protein